MHDDVKAKAMETLMKELEEGKNSGSLIDETDAFADLSEAECP